MFIFTALIRSLWKSNVFSRVCLPVQGGGPHVIGPHLFNLVHLGTHIHSLNPNLPPPRLFKLVHHIAYTSIGKLAVGLRLKGLVA